MRRLSVLIVVTVALAACSSSGHTATPPPAPSAASTTTTTLAAAPTPGCSKPQPKNLERIDLKVGGQPRYALVHVPIHSDNTKPLPLVLSFHGLGASAVNQRGTDGFVAHSDKENFIVAYPQAGGTLSSLGAAWNFK